MKKLIFFLLAAVLMIGLQSCESCSAPQANGVDIVYNVTATAEGEVEFGWMNGGAKINGNAEIFQCNDTTEVLRRSAVREDAKPLAEAINSENAEEAKAANEVADFITVKGVEGKYHLAIKGYVKYGAMVFMIDEEYPKTATDSIQ